MRATQFVIPAGIQNHIFRYLHCRKKNPITNALLSIYPHHGRSGLFINYQWISDLFNYWQ